MTTDELESLLEAAGEAQNLDFKASCEWHAPSFAKDILAFSNLPDGGYIIIGVEDKTLRRQGVDPTHRKTFDIDRMKDQVAGYADPHVSFDVEFPIDREGIEYAVIRIRSFDQLPVICRRDSEHTKAGVVYYRNRNRRIESAPISNSADMRELIELATVRTADRWRRLGLQVSPGLDAQLDEELGGL